MIIEWDFWANIAFFVGALVWLASPITCELTYMSSECHFVEFLASIAFLFCAILYLIYDWELGFFRRTDIYLAVYAGGLGNGGLEGLLEGTNWFTFNHMLFFLGTCIEVTSTIIGNFFIWDASIKSLLEICTSHVWIVAGLGMILMDFLDRRARDHYSSKIQFRLFSCFASDWNSPNYYVFFHFSGWASFFFYWVLWLMEYILGVIGLLLRNGGLGFYNSQLLCFFFGTAICNFVAYKKLIKYKEVWEEDREDAIRYKQDWEVRNLNENSELLRVRRY